MSGRHFVNRKRTVLMPPPQHFAPPAPAPAPVQSANIFGLVIAEQWQAGEGDFLARMLLLSRRLFGTCVMTIFFSLSEEPKLTVISGIEVLPGMNGLLSSPSALMTFLQRLDGILEIHTKPFMTSASRYQHIANGTEETRSRLCVWHW
jgi:hypothetical protein